MYVQIDIKSIPLGPSAGACDFVGPSSVADPRGMVSDTGPKHKSNILVGYVCVWIERIVMYNR